MTLLPIAGRYAILLATSLALGAGGCGARRDGLARGRAVALEPGEERLTTEPRGDGVVGKRGGADASGSPLTALASAPDDPVVARIAGRDITMAELQVPLIEAYGLNVLLNLVQLELAQEHAARVGASVTSQDIEEERRITIARMFQGQKADPEDYDQLLDQFLQKQHISRPEFDLVVQTNAQLRKIAEPQISGKITDAQIEEAFRALYGENVKVRHIQVSNLTEIAEAKRRLGEGQSFEEVARALSRNTRTGALGGELPAFSHMTPGLPDSFKTAAFALQTPGEVSDPVLADNAYHLIRLEQRIAPKAVKFEDVKDSVRETLHDQALQQAVKVLRDQLAEQARTNLTILQPVLKEQFSQRVQKRQTELQSKEEYRREQERERERLQKEQTLPAPGPAPSTASTDTAAPVPVTPESTPTTPAPQADPEVGRPPATMPEAATTAPGLNK